MNKPIAVGALREELDFIARSAEEGGNPAGLIVRLAVAMRSVLDLSVGCCPECGQTVEGWRAPTGSFAPETWATLRERGIDPSTGHKRDCKARP